MAEAPRDRQCRILELRLQLEEEELRLLDMDSESEAEEAAREPRVWTKPWLLRRSDHGAYEKLQAELQAEDPAEFKRMLRVDPALYQEIVQNLTPALEKEETVMREALPVGLRVAITLKYLCTGDTYAGISHLYRVSRSSICNVIEEVCDAIHAHYAEEVLQCPDEPQKWKQAAAKFKDRWQFPHCVGALDGKHVAIERPPRSGSVYYNYKHFYSIILMALVDGDYKFQWVNVGAAGAAGDAQVWNRSDLRNLILEGRIGWPAPEPLEGQEEDSHYFIVGDEAFAMQQWLIKPFARRGLTREQQIFNYRLSRARRIVENAFGILAKRFGVFGTTIKLMPDKVEKVVLAAVCLHNVMRIRYPDDQNRDLEEDQVAGGLAALFPDVDQPAAQGRALRAAKEQRQRLVDYVNSPIGRVAWQDRMVDRR